MSEKKASRVLIVDDMPVNRMILSSLLASNGVESDLAESGQACIDLCEQHEYDLILLDHRMPELDGIDTFLRLKEIFAERGREVPVVCHTTEDARKNINLYKAAGFVDVLIKPIQPQQLSEILMTYLPEGSKGEQADDHEEHEEREREYFRLPDWLRSVPGLDAMNGIDHCETAEDLLDAFYVFCSSIPEKATEIEAFWKEENWPMFTLRVHSLKSMARLIGADALSENAAALEDAGKKRSTDKLKADAPALLREYRAFGEYLSKLSAERNVPELRIHPMPEISEATLKDAYTAIVEFASCYDADNIEMVLSSMKDYRLSAGDNDRFDAIRNALRKRDWEQLRLLAGELL